MPRPNAPRTINRERSVAAHFARVREANGWTYDRLATKMTQAGCPIQASALYKIESADPPRRITVDELVAFSDVSGIGVADLLVPPPIAARRDLKAKFRAWSDANRARNEAWMAADLALEELARLVQAAADPELDAVLASELVSWAAVEEPGQDVTEVVEAWTEILQRLRTDVGAERTD